ncbi:hypothetical protein [Steroidobacter sp.]|uniref:hypothetical protein n=1 Tax=Steroidobacter sp. TaxID=1978227 RepID=UPI001A3995EF|nr:hypothetical protein [Steroidobacter sp.]MBL8266207.1 hypothetical protein [Steroidobacter sp.]
MRLPDGAAAGRKFFVFMARLPPRQVKLMHGFFFFSRRQPREEKITVAAFLVAMRRYFCFFTE